MAYASFRCLVKAPLATVWQSLRDKAVARAGAFSASVPQGVQLREDVIIDSERNEIIIRLASGQSLQGERRYALSTNSTHEAAVLETVLNWKTSSTELDQALMKAPVDILVRDFALEIKRELEVG